MQFNKYMHIERFGKSKKIEGIERGTCYIFPKIDGSNASVWSEKGVICVGSRNEVCSEKHNGKGLYQAVKNDKEIEKLLLDNSKLRLYGEYLIPHTLKEYNKESWGKFYIFDVAMELDNGEETLLSYDVYSLMLEKYAVSYIKPMEILNYPTTSDFARLLESNKYLLDSSDVIGEGIIIKNYNYISRQTKKQLFAKIVREEFIAEHHNLEYDEKMGTYISKTVEEKIADEYFTDSFIEKEIVKAIDILFGGEFKKEDRKRIPEIFDFVFLAFVEEDMRNVIEQYKKPDISFLKLFNLCRERIKKVSDIFQR